MDDALSVKATETEILNRLGLKAGYVIHEDREQSGREWVVTRRWIENVDGTTQELLLPSSPAPCRGK